MQQSIQQYYLPFLPLLLGVSYSVSCSQCSPKVLLSSKFDDLHRFMCLKTRSPAGGAIFIYFSDFGGGAFGYRTLLFSLGWPREHCLAQASWNSQTSSCLCHCQPCEYRQENICFSNFYVLLPPPLGTQIIDLDEIATFEKPINCFTQLTNINMAGNSNWRKVFGLTF